MAATVPAPIRFSGTSLKRASKNCAARSQATYGCGDRSKCPPASPEPYSELGSPEAPAVDVC